MIHSLLCSRLVSHRHMSKAVTPLSTKHIAGARTATRPAPLGIWLVSPTVGLAAKMSDGPEEISPRNRSKRKKQPSKGEREREQQAQAWRRAF